MATAEPIQSLTRCAAAPPVGGSGWRRTAASQGPTGPSGRPPGSAPSPERAVWGFASRPLLPPPERPELHCGPSGNAARALPGLRPRPAASSPSSGPPSRPAARSPVLVSQPAQDRPGAAPGALGNVVPSASRRPVAQSMSGPAAFTELQFPAARARGAWPGGRLGPERRPRPRETGHRFVPTGSAALTPPPCPGPRSSVKFPGVEEGFPEV